MYNTFLCAQGYWASIYPNKMTTIFSCSMLISKTHAEHHQLWSIASCWGLDCTLHEGRKSWGKRQGELRTAAEITEQRRKKEAMRIQQQGGKNKRRQPVGAWWTQQQIGTTENSWKEMMCTLYHTMIISTAYLYELYKLYENYLSKFNS